MAPVELTAGRRAVVVLGASNVSRGLARLAAAVQGGAPELVDLFVAAGHGRGYGVSSRVWQRRLPSILQSGLWRALDRESADQPLALVTDVGNELLYGLGVAAVAGAVREAARRLAERGARLVITGLPVAGIAGVGPVRYRLLRTLYVPGCPLPLDRLQEAAEWLDDEVRAIAADTSATFLPQPPDWYGFDAIHVRRSRLDHLFGAACDAWGLPAAGRRRASFREWAVLGSRAAEVRALAGSVRFTPQPAFRSRGGLRLWLY